MTMNKYKKLIFKLKKKYKLLGEGRLKYCFQINEDLVLKVPKEIEGEDDLFYEEMIYKKYKKDNSIKYAEC